jgi:hypothetical protein
MTVPQELVVQFHTLNVSDEMLGASTQNESSIPKQC